MPDDNAEPTRGEPPLPGPPPLPGEPPPPGRPFSEAVTGRRRRRSLLIGGLALGLILALVIAIALAPIPRRSRATGPSPAGSTDGTPATAGQAPPSAVPSVNQAGSPTLVGPSVGPSAGRSAPPGANPSSWVIQLQGYGAGTIAALSHAPQPLVVIDLAHDASADYFTAAEIATLHRAGKTVLSYFEIGAIEDNRPEYPHLRSAAADVVANQWPSWPHEYFVRYWDPRWWDDVVRPRVDQALRAGFDGVYLDTPLAYSEIDLSLVPGQTRESLGRLMVDLIMRLSAYAKARHPGMLVFPQNSPELRGYPGYTGAIDGIGIEELFYLATDQPCDLDYCPEHLRHARALRAAGKAVLAIDYATRPANIAAACTRYRTEGFAGYVTTVDVGRISTACP